MASRKHVEDAPVGVTGYVLYRCRCEECVDAYNALGETPRERRLNSPVKPPHIHGTWNGFSNHGCRCDKCYEASRARYEMNAAYRRVHRTELQAKQRERRRAAQRDKGLAKEMGLS